jgi:hypothetical protein
MSFDSLVASAACFAGAVHRGVEAAGVILVAVVVVARALAPMVRTVAAAIATAADPAAHTVGIRVFTGVRYIGALGLPQASYPPDRMKISLHVSDGTFVAIF